MVVVVVVVVVVVGVVLLLLLLLLVGRLKVCRQGAMQHHEVKLRGWESVCCGGVVGWLSLLLFVSLLLR